MNDLVKMLIGLLLVGAIGNVVAQPQAMRFLSDVGEWLFLICAGGMGVAALGGLLFALYRLSASFMTKRQMQAQSEAVSSEAERQLALREQELALERLRLQLEHQRQMEAAQVVVIEGRIPVSAALVKNGQIPFETLQLLGLNIEAHRTAAQPKARKQNNPQRYEPKFDDVVIDGDPAVAAVAGQTDANDERLISKQQIVKLDTPLQRSYDDSMVEEGERLSLAQTFQQSTPYSWIVGQNSESGELLHYSPKNDVHLSVLGGTGCGKTSNSAFHLALYALMSGMHLVILDGKDGLDWRIFDGYAEFYEVDWHTLAGYVANLIEHYEYRMGYLKEQGAANIFDLPSNPFQPIFVLFEEYGSVAMALKNQDKAAYDNMNLMLDELLRKSRATGIYMTFLDQVPENYSKQMIGNIKLKLVYKLGGMSGNTVAEYYTKKLADRGQFSCSNTFYDAWFVEPEVQKYFKMLHKCTIKLLGGGVTSGEPPLSNRHQPKSPVVTTENVLIGSDDSVESSSSKTHPDPAVTGDENGIVTTPQDAVTGQILSGKPRTEREKAIVLETYQATGSKNKTIEMLWGKKNQDRLNWLNQILDENRGMQGAQAA